MFSQASSGTDAAALFSQSSGSSTSQETPVAARSKQLFADEYLQSITMETILLTKRLLGKSTARHLRRENGGARHSSI
jgi:hypothetical protein